MQEIIGKVDLQLFDARSHSSWIDGAASPKVWQKDDGLRSLLVDEVKRRGLSLIHIHIQVHLGAQVEVEEGVDTEDKEQDRSDDQERILKRRGRF